MDLEAQYLVVEKQERNGSSALDVRSCELPESPMIMWPQRLLFAARVDHFSEGSARKECWQDEVEVSDVLL